MASAVDSNAISHQVLKTDGTNVSYRWLGVAHADGVKLFPGGELLCSGNAFSGPGSCPQPFLMGAIRRSTANPWPLQNAWDVWLRSPDGTKTQISTFQASSWPRAVNEKGDAILATGALNPLGADTSSGDVAFGPSAHQYLVKNGALPVEMPVVDVRAINGRWYFLAPSSIVLVGEPDAVDAGQDATLPLVDAGFDAGRPATPARTTGDAVDIAEADSSDEAIRDGGFIRTHRSGCRRRARQHRTRGNSGREQIRGRGPGC